MENKKVSLSCIHWALNKCADNVLSLEELNEQIDPLFVEMKKQYPAWKREWCGIEDITWHQQCIAKAMKKKYRSGSYVWERIPCDGIQDLWDSHKTGRFYLHGILNYKHFSEKPDGNWTHAICIDLDKEKFFDNTSPKLKRGYSISKWFIKCRKEDRYLSRIDRVYQLQINCKLKI